MKRNLMIVTMVTSVLIGLLSCGGGEVTKSKEYLALKAELDKIKTQDSLEASNIATYKKMNEDFMNNRKDEFLAALADDYMDHNADTFMTKKTGKAGQEEMITMINGAFTEMTMNYVHIYAEGDMVFSHATMDGKNTGAMGPDMPATGKGYKGVDFYKVVRFENGKVAERWGIMDSYSMMAQMGVPM